MKRYRLKRYNFQNRNDMDKEKKTSGKRKNGNDFIADVSKRYYLTKDRQGNYQVLNELAYEKKLIYG
jgi:hypothetical protein